jgi:hypothetical protein
VQGTLISSFWNDLCEDPDLFKLPLRIIALDIDPGVDFAGPVLGVEDHLQDGAAVGRDLVGGERHRIAAAGGALRLKKKSTMATARSIIAIRIKTDFIFKLNFLWT